MSKTKLTISVVGLTAVLALAGCGSSNITVEEGQSMLEDAFQNGADILSQEVAGEMNFEFDITQANAFSGESERVSGTVDLMGEGYISIAESNMGGDGNLEINFDVSGPGPTGEVEQYTGFVKGGIALTEDTLYFNADIDREFLTTVAGGFAPLAEGYLSSGSDKKWWSVPLPPEVQSEFKSELEGLNDEDLVLPEASFFNVTAHEGSEDILGVDSECFTVEVKAEDLQTYIEELAAANPAVTFEPGDIEEMELALQYLNLNEAKVCVSTEDTPVVTHMEISANIDLAELAAEIEAEAVENDPSFEAEAEPEGSLSFTYKFSAVPSDRGVTVPEDSQPLDLGQFAGGSAAPSADLDADFEAQLEAGEFEIDADFEADSL